VTTKPSALFVCVHNAGRSQMAAGYLNHLAGDRIEVRSAGSEPADRINPAAVAAMAEEGIDIAAGAPKILTTEAVKNSDVVITMGCGDTCPFYPKTGCSTILPAKASTMSDRSATRSNAGSSN
jgi:arsenate reductase